MIVFHSEYVCSTQILASPTLNRAFVGSDKSAISRYRSPATCYRRNALKNFPATRHLILILETQWFSGLSQTLINALHWPKLAQIRARAWEMLNRALAGCSSWKAAHLTSAALRMTFHLCVMKNFHFSKCFLYEVLNTYNCAPCSQSAALLAELLSQWQAWQMDTQI